MSLPPGPDPQSPTGIAGFDEILCGGLPENRLYLLLGEPGVGKTTLALQYLLEGERLGDRGLYIALSETKDEIMSVARSHGWDMSNLAIFELSALEQRLAQETQNTVFHPAEIELGKTTQLLLDEIRRVKPKRLVLDSLSELRLLSDSPLRYRRQMLSFKQYFAGEAVTVLLLDDHSAGGGDLHVQSIAHGVVTIDQVVNEYGTGRRRVRVNKLRGLNFLSGYHDATIVPGGMKIFPRISPTKANRSDARELVGSDLPELDALLGGGLDRGTSCLLLGPAGTGKSSMGLQFALAAARRGEPSLVCLFEENIGTLRARAASIGLDLESALKSGLVQLCEIDPADLSPGEFGYMVVDNVRRRKARVVLIDSLNGYMQAMPDVKTLTVQMHELLSYLNHEGVISVLTIAQSGMLGQMQTPVEITYLADSVILLRFFEQGGRVKKAVSVIKKRTGSHEDTIREFRIDAHGLRVGEALEQFRGVLTGTPVFVGQGDQMIQKR